MVVLTILSKNEWLSVHGSDSVTLQLVAEASNGHSTYTFKCRAIQRELAVCSSATYDTAQPKTLTSQKTILILVLLLGCEVDVFHPEVFIRINMIKLVSLNTTNVCNIIYIT
jgi:hypothetical protein